jgi:hypothetical protein
MRKQERVISQKKILFKTTAVKTSNPTQERTRLNIILSLDISALVQSLRLWTRGEMRAVCCNKLQRPPTLSAAAFRVVQSLLLNNLKRRTGELKHVIEGKLSIERFQCRLIKVSLYTSPLG